MTYTEAEVRQLVRARGPQKEFARQAGISPQYVSDFMTGRRAPGFGILNALGLERVTIIREKGACNTKLSGL